MAPGARLHLTDVLGAWRVDPSRHTADTNGDGQLLVSEDVVVTRNFDETVFDRAYEDDFTATERDDGTVWIAIENYVCAETLYLTFSRDAGGGLVVELLGCDVLPWKASFPLVALESPG